jgi:cysteine-rich repeat protein
VLHLTTDHDGCSSICQIEEDFNCAGSPSVCTAVCGDGIVAGQELCDDGNQTIGDRCSDVCQVEPGYICTGSPSVCMH